MFDDNRVNNFTPYIIDIKNYQWSTEWHKFPGLPMINAVDRIVIDGKADKILDFMQNQWHISIIISLIYFVVIFSIRHWMKNRPAYHLRKQLVAWNLLLALFSIIGTIKCLPEFVDVLWKKGFTPSFCDSTYFFDIRLVAWYWYFVMSKAFELGDTIFIVLRKQKLYNLHWIHHIITLCFCWFVFADIPGTARWMVNMNFLIHSIMYTYYALRASGMKIRKQLAMCITVSQIVQMLFGFYINIKSFEYKITGTPCDLSIPVAVTGFIIYSLFFVLFLNYFIKSYILPIFHHKNLKTPSIQQFNEQVIKKVQ